MAKARRTTAKLIGGVDIGGTKLHAVVATLDGRVVATARKKTRAKRGFDAVMDRVVKCLEEACRAAGVCPKDLAAVGVGAPSPIRKDGTAVDGPNVGWRNAPVAKSLSRRLGRAVVAENDCNLGTLAEVRLGAGKNATTVVGLFVGTGLGGGIVHRQEMLRGEARLAAELGHMVVVANGRRCGCGRAGCLEAYASKTGISKQIRAAVEKDHRRSAISGEAEIDLDNIPSSVLARLYGRRDRVVRAAVDEAATYLGIGVANVITLLGPEKVVLGGGVIEAMGKRLLARVKAAARAQVFPAAQAATSSIVLSKLGDDAVALGAALYAWDRRRGGPSSGSPTTVPLRGGATTRHR
ncbi:MAG: ROK family protein [Deltaproteobacteria bacterium]|nr:ROK family protein [Deltaproteobacteria bacterium]